MPTTRQAPTSEQSASRRELHVIVGAGAVGSGLALELAASGRDVRVVTRSGTGPEHESIERVALDATDATELGSAAAGARSLYNCANLPYQRWADGWPPMAASLLAAARQSGAGLVTMSNLYGYRPNGHPMRETGQLDPPSRKGAIRATMWNDALAAHERGEIRATEARASDFVGPGIGETAHMGDRVVPRVLAGKSVSLVGDPDVLHSWTSIADVATTLATLGTDDRSLGKPWHVPTAAPLTGRDLVNRMADVAGVERVSVRSIPRPALRLLGLFSAPIRELGEMLYQFDEPFVMDSSLTEQTFGLAPTPIDTTVRAAIEAARAEVSVASS